MNEDSEEQIVEFECKHFECRFSPDGIGVAVRYKDLEKVKAYCPICGKPLVLKLDVDLKLMLAPLKIKSF